MISVLNTLLFAVVMIPCVTFLVLGLIYLAGEVFSTLAEPNSQRTLHSMYQDILKKIIGKKRNG